MPCAYLADEVSALGAGVLAMAAIEASYTNNYAKSTQT